MDINRLTSDLAWLTLAIAAGIFVVVEALLIASTLRLRHAHRGDAPPRAHGPAPTPDDRASLLPVRVHWAWELVWTVLPALGLLALGVLGVRGLLGFPPH